MAMGSSHVRSTHNEMIDYKVRKHRPREMNNPYFFHNTCKKHGSRHALGGFCSMDVCASARCPPVARFLIKNLKASSSTGAAHATRDDIWSTLLQLSIYSSILEILDFGWSEKALKSHIEIYSRHLNFTDNRQPKIIKNCGWFPPSAGFGVTWGVHEASTLRYLVECEESGPLQYRVVASWCI